MRPVATAVLQLSTLRTIHTEFTFCAIMTALHGGLTRPYNPS